MSESKIREIRHVFLQKVKMENETDEKEFEEMEQSASGMMERVAERTARLKKRGHSSFGSAKRFKKSKEIQKSKTSEIGDQ